MSELKERMSLFLIDEENNNVFKHLAGKHDQRTHGNWANNDITVNDSGSNLVFRDRVDLQLGSDRYQSDIYKAESEVFDRDSGTPPVAPKRENFDSYEAYEKAWTQYSKNFDDWQSSANDLQVSELGKKHIDGTVKGIKNLYKEITSSDWFIAEFGDGSRVPELKIAVRKSGSFAGRHRWGIKISGSKGYQEINEILIHKNYAKDESTLIHELAHYATMLKADNKYEGHGVEFARNQLFIWEHVAGKEVADNLRQGYLDKGIPV